MKNKYIYIVLSAFIVLCIAGCSPRKNTWLSRHYQAMTTHYNVYFNGKEKLKEGISNIFKSNKDDYSDILPLYPISNKSSQQIATSEMDKAIEKAHKAIELHSIRKKPKFDSKRQKDPKYQEFMNKEEYNTQIDEAWMLLGEAQFYKGDFLASMASFSYVIKHFHELKYRVLEANIWLARSYEELGWFYDAEDVLTKLNKEIIPSSLIAQFDAAQADLYLKRYKYNEAIEPLSIAAQYERNKNQRARFNFVLAQLYRKNDENQLSVHCYDKVIHSNMPYLMDFNAKVNRAEANNANMQKVLHQLHNMLKSSKYQNDSDKIYYTIGRVYQANNQDDNAVINYKLAIDKSKNNSSNKIQALVALADLFYSKSKYIEAYPFYNEASALMLPQNTDYNRVSKRGQMLGELSLQADIVHQQDSMQQLASLAPDLRDAKINEQIKRKQEEEIALRKKIEDEQKRQASESNIAQMNASNDNFSNGVQQQFGVSWYFYNPLLINNGKKDFQSKWGNRKLEDNWIRSEKSSTIDNDEGELKLSDNNINENNIEDSNNNDSIKKTEKKSSINTDLKFYIDNLPLSYEQKKFSDTQIASALFRMGTIYEEDLEDIPMAIKTFEDLENRFPKDKHLPDAYFLLFQMYKKKLDHSNAEFYRLRLVQKFPESSYAKVLGNPDYENNIRRMNAMQDSLYASSYRHYKHGEYDSLFVNYNYIQEKYPLSSLMPKFMFINALGKAKTGDVESFKKGLEKLIVDYPKSDVSSISKNLLALLEQGKKVQIDDNRNSIIAVRDSVDKLTAAKDTVKFSDDNRERYLVVYIVPKGININGLQFAIASYNFTGFLVKDFDLQVNKYNADTILFSISALDNLDEAVWYFNGMKYDEGIKRYIDSGCQTLLISESNYDLIKMGRSIQEYQIFYKNKIEPQIKVKKANESSENINFMRQESMAATDSLVVKANSMFQEQTGESYVNDKKTTYKSLEIQNNDKHQKQEQVIKNKELTKAKRNKIEKRQDIKKEKNKVYTTALPTKGFFKVEEFSSYSYAILIKRQGVELSDVKNAIDKYNEKYYPVANFKTKIIEMAGGEKMLLVNTFDMANNAKSYLFRIIRQPEIFKSIKGVDYRNVIISEHNQQELISSRDIDGYLVFNKDNYLK